MKFVKFDVSSSQLFSGNFQFDHKHFFFFFLLFSSNSISCFTIFTDVYECVQLETVL